MDVFVETIQGIINSSGFTAMTWQQGVMILVSFVLLYLAIAKKFEPLLLLPIAFGMFLANLPMGELYHPESVSYTHLDVYKRQGEPRFHL